MQEQGLNLAVGGCSSELRLLPSDRDRYRNIAKMVPLVGRLSRKTENIRCSITTSKRAIQFSHLHFIDKAHREAIGLRSDLSHQSAQPSSEVRGSALAISLRILEYELQPLPLSPGRLGMRIRFLLVVLVIGPHDLLYESVPNHVSLGELDEFDAFH